MFLRGALLGTTLLSLATPVFAQDPAEDVGGNEEITVTAQRRSEKSQDVPLAVTALDTKAIDRLNTRDVRDLNGRVPNLVINDTGLGPGLAQMSLRGVNFQDVEKSFDPAVGVFIDGIYLGTSAFNVLDTFDLERIEVLRGPQGTLFGRNTTGGALNVVRSVPTGELSFKGRAVFGSYSRTDFQGVFNAPLIDNILAVKLAGYYQKDDGMWENRSPVGVRDNGAKDKWGGAVTLRYSPSENFDATLTYEHAVDKSGIAPYVPRNVAVPSLLPILITQTSFPTSPATIFAANPADRFCTTPGGRCLTNDPSFTMANDAHRIDADLDAVTFNARWNIGSNYELAVVAGWRDSDEKVYIDFDGTELTIFNVLRQQHYSQWSAEARLASNYDGPFNFVAGAFYFHSEYELQQAIKLDQRVGAGLNQAIGVGYINGSGDGDWHEAQTYAVFAQGDLKLSETVTFTVGGRATWDSKEIYTEFYGAPFGSAPNAYQVTNGIPLGRAITSRGGAKDDWFQFTPRVAINWQPYDNLLLYASFSKGYNAGGFSARAGTVAAVTTPFDPESINSYEIGVKSDFLNNRLRINAAVFFNDYLNKQEETLAPAPPPTFTSTTVRNASTAQIAGFELEVQARITENLRFDASFGYLDASYSKFDAFLASSQYVSTPAQPAGTLIRADFSSLTLRRAPEFTASFSPTWEQEIGNGLLTLTGTVRYIGETQADFYNDPRGLIADQTLIDVSASYEFGGPDLDMYAIKIFGKNITDHQEVNTFTNSIVDFGSVQPPATWGLELTVKM
jgi:iron complex outermembrane receptor protein